MALAKIEIIASNAKLEKLQHVLEEEGVSGLTVMQVIGCGKQKGSYEYAVEENEEFMLLPKQQVNIIVDADRVDDIVNMVKMELYTGHIGDGKIFVYPCTNAIRIRTGEEGLEAL